jgi:hypothetical protein
VLNLRTGDVRTVFDEESPYGEDSGWAYAWSPDGKWLAVMRATQDDCVDDPTATFCDHTELWIVAASGAGANQVYTGPDHSLSNGVDWRRSS